MQVTRKCRFDGQMYTMEIPSLTPKILDEVHARCQSGMLLQNAAPFLNPSEREFILTGTPPEVWDAMFGE